MLRDVREEIQKIDDQIIELIAHRTGLAEKILDAKKKENVEIDDEEQNKVVLKRAVEAATEHGMDVGAVKRIYEILIKMSIERQRELSGRGKLQPS
ncbi:MAG: chorismate mutase [Methanocellales archaeon]|nr:chorismate mutase [Methanocellales archaeon]MDD3292260.1 chorismate mutase [Methanocellales archaeon]MDD5235966.1 chorismate mutase [Methanocellales archaeon]MDD5484876.1 chorismate mutase [Methanocellales archaeon]